MSRHVALLIEDDPMVAELVIDLLGSIGHGVIHVAAKEEALEKIGTAEACYVILGLERRAERSSIAAMVRESLIAARPCRRSRRAGPSGSAC